MLALSVLLVLISMIAFVVCLIRLIIKAVKRQTIKQTVIALGICIVVFIGGAAIMPTNDFETEEKASESVQIETEDTEKEEVVEKKLFDDIFVELSEQVGEMTYEDCIKYMDNQAITYDTTKPSDEDMGNISVDDKDNNGFKLVIDFYPDDDGNKETMTLLSYSNGDFEGSVSDNFHMNDVTFGIYDVTAEERNIDVDSLEDVISFIKNDVPQKMEEYANSVSDNNEIEVTLEPSYEIINGAISFTIATNLPDDTELMLTLSDGNDYTGQTKVTVKNGVATSEGFSNKGKQLSGHFTLDITMALPKQQDESVIKVIGTQGEFLTGKYVEKDTTGESNTVSGTFEYDF
jgi:hypothetical protein